MEDEAIVSLLFSKDAEGLDALSSKYGALLLSVAGHILPQRDAEEAVNDCYFKVWKTIPPYRPVYLRSFLCKVVRQIALDRWRTAHRKKRDETALADLEDLELLAAPVQDDAYEGVGAAIDAFLDGLDVESRTLFVRRYFLWESPASLAQRFGLTENHVSVKLHRLREKLRKYLRKEGYAI